MEIFTVASYPVWKKIQHSIITNLCLLIFSVVEVYPDSSSVEIINPKDDNMKTNKKAFTFDAVHDWK